MGAYSFKSSGNTPKKIIDQNPINLEPQAIGIKTPLSLDNKNLFSMHYNLAEQIHDNLKNLLLTNWGERVGLYFYGANLRELAFELNSTTSFDDLAIERIKKAVNKWMPFIKLNDFVSNVDNQLNKHTGIIKILITYGIPQLGIEDRSLQVSLYVV